MGMQRKRTDNTMAREKGQTMQWPEKKGQIIQWPEKKDK
jgi:hypothetical protein